MTKHLINHRTTPDTLIDLCVSKGVPQQLFSTAMLVSKYLTTFGYENRAGKYVSINASRQLKTFDLIMKNPLAKPYTLVIGSSDYDKLAQCVALAIYKKVMTYYHTHFQDIGNHNQPLWYPVYGSRHDRLRDDKNFRYSAGNPLLLVIDNFPRNATPEKTEKVRDLLDMYNNTPKIVIAAGADPFEVAQKYLYLQPTYMLYVQKKGG